MDPESLKCASCQAAMTSPQNGNTVFLTEQEADRIRSVIVEGKRKASEVTGNAREPRDAESSIKAATGASLMADMAGGLGSEWQAGAGGQTLPVLTVGHVYPACTVSLSELEYIKLADLKQETHHRGRKILLERVSPVVTLAARSWTMVQGDEGDDTERLEAVLHKLKHGEEVLEASARFIIKEPYLTFNEEGETTLRIDHASDLVVMYDEVKPPTTNGTVADHEKNGTTSDATLDQARKAKAEGDAAVKKQDYPAAYEAYTRAFQGLATIDNSDDVVSLTKEIYRSRAALALSMGRADAAVSDANSSLTGGEDSESKELDSQAYTLAARAVYSMKNFATAKSFVEQAIELSPSNDASALLNKIQARIKQQDTGKYDLKKIRAGLSRSKPEADVADFLRRTEVKDSPGKGRGLYAACDIPAGGIVMVEKAFCVVWGFQKETLTAMTYDVRDDRIRVAPVGLSRAVTHKLLNNPSQRSRILDLCGQYAGDVPVECRTAEGPVVDIFRIHDIVSRNAFSPGAQFGDEDARTASTGLWVRADYANHSCDANSAKEFIGDVMLVRASRAIKTGEEIFHSYVDPSLDVEARTHALMETWGFECQCWLCEAQRGEDVALRRKRREMVAEAEAFMAREHWSGAKRLTIVRAQRLVNGIEGTYDPERYKGRMYGQHFPQVVESLKEWLSKASPRK